MDTYLYRKNKHVATFTPQGEATFIDPTSAPYIIQRTHALEAFKRQRESDVTRTNMRYLRKLMGISARNAREALDKINGFSLFDTFWYQGANDGLTWEDVRLTKNHAFEVALTGKSWDPSAFTDPRTPEHSNIGSYEKGWKWAAGRWQLYKAGTPAQLWSEIFATRLLASKGVNVVHYWLEENWSVCENFIHQDQDMCLEHYHSFGGEDTEESTVLGMPFLTPPLIQDLKTMYYCDALLMNFDRHEFNFGFLTPGRQDAPLTLAPLFDWNLCLFGHQYPRSYTRTADPMIQGVLKAGIKPPFHITAEEIKILYQEIQQETQLTIEASEAQVVEYVRSSQALLQ